MNIILHITSGNKSIKHDFIELTFKKNFELKEVPIDEIIKQIALVAHVVNLVC